MIVTREEMKQYLRVDYEEDDALIDSFILGAEKTCIDVLRMDDAEEFYQVDNAKIAVMYAVAYLYEHREEADHHAMILTLRSLLFGDRREGF